MRGGSNKTDPARVRCAHVENTSVRLKKSKSGIDCHWAFITCPWVFSPTLGAKKAAFLEPLRGGAGRIAQPLPWRVKTAEDSSQGAQATRAARAEKKLPAREKK